MTPRPDGEGEILSMKQALQMAGIEPAQIGYINAHGTATIKGDITENLSVKEVFGADSDVLIGSTKAATGHMMGAGGITEVITCIKAMETGILPPTLNLENKDPECDHELCHSEDQTGWITPCRTPSDSADRTPA